MKIERITEEISLKRSVDTGTAEQRKTVKKIIADVKETGDKAVQHYTKKFDNVAISSLKVSEAERVEAYKKIDSALLDVIKEAAENIRVFHKKQLQDSWFMTKQDGTLLGQRVTPLDSVGVYVPGGTASYPSSVLMNVIPAKVAGVERIVMTSPVDEKGEIPAPVLVAADIAGVKEIYKVGGAQAIAALAYGTESIEQVDKIVGPGNIYVALAKREVFGDVDIDMIAGPSEIVVLADDTAYADEVAADLLSQAEHDPLACSILVTPSEQLAEKVSVEVTKQLNELPRKEIAKQSIENYGAIYVTNTIEEAIAAVNNLAPEHLEIITKNSVDVITKIRHAGAIFVGRWSSEPVGDYFAGPNHVLPTNGTARFSSPLNIEDFRKKSSIIVYSEKALQENYKKIATFARAEGLEAHARAVEKRFARK